MNPELMLTHGGSVFDEYCAYVKERHQVWELRSMGLPAPWTASPILSVTKFTNNFRVLDTGSQYVLRMVQDAPTDWDVVLRAFLYRLTNLPDLWEWYIHRVGRWPVLEDVKSGRLRSVVLDAAANMNGSIFSSAYMISPGAANKGMTRPEWLAMITEESFRPGGAYRLSPALADPSTPLHRRVEILRGTPRIAGFLAQQIATDIGYSDRLPTDEDESVVTGPGSKRGLKTLGLPETSDSIRSLHAEIRSIVTLDVYGTPRPLSLMDVQNTLCEFGKYHGLISSRGNRARRFTPAPTTTYVHTEPVFPNHWRSR